MKFLLYKLRSKIRIWLGITTLDKEIMNFIYELQSHKKFVTAKVAELKEYTRVDADMGYRGNNTIILTGVYRGKAYVRFYDMGDGEFEKLIEQMKYMKDHCLIRNVDKPPEFHGVFNLF